jgi:DNA-directed RNA polymerase subunit RPC12/RpoP
MSIEFRCPNCEKKLRTGDDKAGKTAKCPQCGSAVVVPAASQVATELEPFPSFDGDIEDQAGFPPARSSRSASEVACPMCGAMNLASAPRCLSCGEDLDGAAAASGQKPSLRFGDIWQSAWDKWSANLGLCVASILIAGLILFAMFMVTYGVMIFAVILAFGGAGPGGGNNQGPVIVGLIIAVVLLVLAALVLTAYLQVGLANFSIGLARRLPGSLGSMFPPVQKLPATIVCMLVVYLAVFVLMLPAYAASFGGQAMVMNENNAGIFLVLLAYPLQFGAAIIANCIFWPIPYLIADRRSGLMSAVVDGPKLALYNWKLSVLLALVNLGLSFLGSLTCGIGLLFTYSLSFLLFAIAFDRLKRHAPVQ